MSFRTTSGCCTRSGRCLRNWKPSCAPGSSVSRNWNAVSCTALRRRRGCVVKLAAPAAAAAHLAALLKEQLARVQLPEPVRSLELRADTLLAHVPQAQALWQPGEHGGGGGREAHGLIERLRARLGEEAVYGLTLLEGHRPERTWALTAPPPVAATPPPRRRRRRQHRAGRCGCCWSRSP